MWARSTGCRRSTCRGTCAAFRIGEFEGRHNARDLFYRTANGMMAAVIETGPSFKVRKRELLFEDDYARNPGGAQYDIDPRSGQFLLIKRAVGDVSIVVVVNWFEEVRRLTGEAN